MSAPQRKKLIVLMINMFIAIGSFGIIIPILPAYLESIHQGGTAAGLMLRSLLEHSSFFLLLLENGPINMVVEK